MRLRVGYDVCCMSDVVNAVNSQVSEHAESKIIPQPAIALLPWGNVIEDFIDKIGVSLEAFCNEFTGSWMFGYADALQRAGVRTVLICMSSRIAVPTRFEHAPTGATIWILPVPKTYRALQRKMVNPYGRTVNQVFGAGRHVSRVLLWPLLAAMKEIVLYSTTPLKLIADELRREGCTAILCQEYEYPRFDICVLLGRMMHLPVFATFQGGNYQRCWIERYLRPLSIRACNGLIIAAKAEAERVQSRYGTPARKLARIFNPVNLDLWNSIDRAIGRQALNISLDVQLVVWHGRVSIQQKGLDLLLDAWDLICRQRPGRALRLLLIGTGKDADQLQKRIAAVAPQSVVWVNDFVHDRNRMRCYLSAGDIYAFPSRHEGFPVSPLEAMACGLPVVAADAPGIPDILDGGEASGGVVVPRENVTELALALGRLLDNREWCRELGKRARHRVESNFSREVVGQQLRHFLLKEESRNSGPHAEKSYSI
jgi:glycosyltransferase involved in cell wall biosynthesis